MDVYEAVESRRSVRWFSGEPVPRETLERVLATAARAPSGSNLQPWNLYVVTGEPLAQLKKRAVARARADDPGDEREFPMYPPELKSPYRERMDAAAEHRYAGLGVARGDTAGRKKARARNWDGFGAPVVMFCYIDRDMGAAQWADLGMYLQTVMLLLRAEGLASCAQVSWSVYWRTVAETVGAGDAEVLFCGVSVGVEDENGNRARMARAPLAQTVRFVGG